MARDHNNNEDDVLHNWDIARKYNIIVAYHKHVLHS